MKKEIVAIVALKGQVSPEQIAKWKKEYPTGIYQIIQGESVSYFSNPTRQELAASYAMVDENASNHELYYELAKMTQIGGCEEWQKSDAKLFGLSKIIAGKIQGEKAEILDL